ncbi:MAG TPA: DNA polymerase III subunit [Vicinamibacterales bacterium]|nr:DNA polymerase III subunit [Vicinamibacterales bacterium]
MPFRDILGHERVLELLARSIEQGSLPPSQLFAGPSGVGKRLVALAVAQALNCLDPVRSAPPEGGAGARSPEPGAARDSCGVCASCTRIARHVHHDVVRLAPDEDGSLGIDEVRAMLDQVAYRPFEARRRVVIIEEADALGSPAQSALLKTLEEPPPATVFILVSARPDALLPTVLSRCPRLRFRSLTVAEIAHALVARGYTEAEARAVAANADGSLGRALEARAGDVLQARQLAGQVLRQVAHGGSPRDRLEQAKALVAKRGSGGSAASDRDQLATYLRAMSSLLRDVELLACGADEQALANADVKPELERLSDAYAGGRSRHAFAAVDRALGALDRNASAKIVADWIVLQL